MKHEAEKDQKKPQNESENTHQMRHNPPTSQEVENVDLMEKGVKSPLNPQKNGMEMNRDDQKTVLNTPVISRSDQPPKNQSQAV